VKGDYAQQAGGALLIAVDGTGNGQYSVLSVSGNVSLDGSLVLAPSSSYANAASTGDALPFLGYTGSRTGTFASTSSNPSLAGGRSFTPDYTSANTVKPSVAPAAPPQAPSVSFTPSRKPTGARRRVGYCTKTASSTARPIRSGTAMDQFSASKQREQKPTYTHFVEHQAMVLSRRVG